MASKGDAATMRRGRPIKYPRPNDCPHTGRPEHANGVCYQCSSNINNQKKRERKSDDIQPGRPIYQKRRRELDDGGTGGFVELNIGGKIFATTLQTLNREASLLSALSSATPHKLAMYDKEGRLFFDRDPTQFRWILNYLRDGYLVTVPEVYNVRLEVLHEARFYSLNTLVSILSVRQYKRIT